MVRTSIGTTTTITRVDFQRKMVRTGSARTGTGRAGVLLLLTVLVDLTYGRAPRQAARLLRGRTCACCSSKPCASNFRVSVRLSDEVLLTQEFQPLFSASEMLTLRLPLPIDLKAAPYAGTLRISEDGYGLRRGDVLRACSSVQKASILWSDAAPKQCLFLADGQPAPVVVKALVANTIDKGVEDLVLVVERETTYDFEALPFKP